MRLTTLALTVTLLAVGPASGQTASNSHPYGLDPYKPSDAALLRAYGVTLVSQTPLPELGRLDPYKPSHAALLRQLGGALPLWGLAWYPLQAPGPVMPLQQRGSLETPITVQLVHPSPVAVATADAATSELPSPSSMATLRAPENNDGVWISYANRKWIAAGQAIPLEESVFERVGEYGTFPVYRRPRASDDVIYLPTRQGLITPYRPKSPSR